MWNFPLFPDQASSNAARVDALFLFELAVILFFTTAICAAVLILVIRFRRGRMVDRSGPPLHAPWLEVTWIVIPLILSLIMFVWSAEVFYRLYSPPPDAAEISVVGKQWMWYLQHPEGRSEINELHVPLGRPVKLMMTSQDVIHSFYVPAFRVKQDVLPGRYTSLWFQPTKAGTYHLFCAEYCGTSHSEMVGSVTVMEPAEYESWLAAGGAGPSQADEGERLFVQHHCAGCHRGSQVVNAPRLEGVFGKPVPIQDGKQVKFVTADERYLRDSILMPRSEVVAGYEPVMPSYQGQIGEPDLLKILAYIKSLAAKETGTGR
ncbi:cytochrome c oxidase subunit II [Aquisphaera insulae]|uniref:cytochrome c oxidase subunit II n=1 Tax=Aquisphaera insulae TaxID=2712864 RepID=UPI0013EC44BB|nr:cytochrome c oxidase subunit II [Aquisphaera insulae]